MDRRTARGARPAPGGAQHPWRCDQPRGARIQPRLRRDFPGAGDARRDVRLRPCGQPAPPSGRPADLRRRLCRRRRRRQPPDRPEIDRSQCRVHGGRRQ